MDEQVLGILGILRDHLPDLITCAITIVAISLYKTNKQTYDQLSLVYNFGLPSIFNLSRGSIISIILFHFANNIASALDKEYIITIVSAGFVFLTVYIISKLQAEHLADVPRLKIYTTTKISL